VTELVGDEPGRERSFIEDGRRGLAEVCEVTQDRSPPPLARGSSRRTLLGSRKPPRVSGNTGMPSNVSAVEEFGSTKPRGSEIGLGRSLSLS
jgi:hypothetical protein